MTFEELNELDDPCSVCPLCGTEYCPHCMEYEPPCAFAEGDIDKWIASIEETNRRLDEAEDRKIREKKRRTEIARRKANTEKRMRLYCQKEMDAVKELERKYKKLKSLSGYAESYAEATNFANEVFGYKERVIVRPEIKVELEELENKIVEAKRAYEEKRKEFCILNQGDEK